MYYVEVMRARRVLFWYGIVLLSILAIVGLSVLTSKTNIDVSNHQGGSETLSAVVGVCAFFALIIATVMSTSLNAEAATTPISWTRPVSRDSIAWSYIAVDLVTIAIAYAAGTLMVLAILAMLGILPYFTIDVGHTIVLATLGLGGAMMWYGLVSLATARMSGHGARIAGLSWAVFLVLGGITAAPFPPLLHGLIVALNYLNPLAWMGTISSGSHNPKIIPWGADVRAMVAWAIALVALFVATRLWSTREA